MKDQAEKANGKSNNFCFGIYMDLIIAKYRMKSIATSKYDRDPDRGLSLKIPCLRTLHTETIPTL
jgi:hypothetical protein